MNAYKGGIQSVGTGPKGMPGKVVNNIEGMSNPGNKLPAKKAGGQGNAAGYRSVAAKSMMR